MVLSTIMAVNDLGTEILFNWQVTIVWTFSNFAKMTSFEVILQYRETDSNRANEEVEESQKCFYWPKTRLMKLPCDKAHCCDVIELFSTFGFTHVTMFRDFSKALGTFWSWGANSLWTISWPSKRQINMHLISVARFGFLILEMLEVCLPFHAPVLGFRVAFEHPRLITGNDTFQKMGIIFNRFYESRCLISLMPFWNHIVLIPNSPIKIWWTVMRVKYSCPRLFGVSTDGRNGQYFGHFIGIWR